MSKEQMELVHLFLVRAIAITTSHGEWPKLVSPTNQAKFLWPASIERVRFGLRKLSFRLLPSGYQCSPPTPHTSRNAKQWKWPLDFWGPKTEVRKILHAREEANRWIVVFSLNDLFVKNLQKSNCHAHIGFKQMTFKIKGSPDIKQAAVLHCLRTRVSIKFARRIEADYLGAGPSSANGEHRSASVIPCVAQASQTGRSAMLVTMGSLPLIACLLTTTIMSTTNGPGQNALLSLRCIFLYTSTHLHAWWLSRTLRSLQDSILEHPVLWIMSDIMLPKQNFIKVW